MSKREDNSQFYSLDNKAIHADGWLAGSDIDDVSYIKLITGLLLDDLML